MSDPSTIGSGLAEWSDFTDTSTLFQDVTGLIPVTATGQSIALAKDQSGNARDGSNAVNPPTWTENLVNGLGAAVFSSATLNYGNLGAWDFVEFTMFFVVATGNTDQNTVILGRDAGGGLVDKLILSWYPDLAPDTLSWISGTTGNYDLPTAPWVRVAGEYNIITATFDGLTLIIRRNGTEILSTTLPNWPASINADMIIAYAEVALGFGNIGLPEFGFYDNPLSAADLASLEGYLGTKYALTVAAPSVTLTLTGSPFAEAGGNATVTGSLSAYSGLNVTVNLDFTGTATNSSDYTRSATSIVIPAGSTSAAITLTGLNDATVEGDETVVVDITSVTNGLEDGEQQVTATITDDDAAPGGDHNLLLLLGVG